jgi:hypothetical protein
MEMIDSRTHAVLDYAVGLLLIVSPYLFGFGQWGIEQWLPQLIGAMTIVMSLFTRYELSIAKIIPFPVHLTVDVIGALTLIASPWVFGFAERIWWPHVSIGVVELVVVLLSRKRADAFADRPRHPAQPGPKVRVVRSDR